MDVDLNNKWNVGNLLKAPMCVVPLIFAPCTSVWAADKQELVASGQVKSYENETFSNDISNGTIFTVAAGGELTLNGVALNSTGARGKGIEVNGKFNARDLVMNVSGLNSTGMILADGAAVELDNLTMTGTGSAKGLVVRDGIIATVNGGNITTDAGIAVNLLSGDLTLNSVNITTEGDDAMGVNAQSGTVVLTGGTVETRGEESNALYTENKIQGTGLEITTRGNASVALDVQQGATGILLNSIVKTYGDVASAIESQNGAKITADNVQITTIGQESYGIWSRGSELAISNSTITTAATTASGMYVGGLGAGDSDITLDNVIIDAKQAQAVEVNTASAVMSVNNSTLSGGNGQVLTVAHNSDNNAYSDIIFNTKNSILNGDINGDITENASRNNLVVDLASTSTLNGAVTNTTSLSIDASSEWNMNNVSDVGNLTNNGTITFSDQTKFDTLSVTGDYAGDGGLLVMNSVLGDDSSLTNKLIVGGDVLAGTTRVAINNLGGQGAQTVEGIEIVEVAGTSIGNFEKADRIVAGAYDYDLAQKGENWYLTSQLAPVDPNGGDNKLPQQPSVIRPESGSYTANLAAANTLFLLTLHDRLGETQFIDALTGQQEVTSMWLRQVGGHNSWRDNSGQLKTQSNRYVAQIGGDIARWSTDGLDRWHLGLMAGYGDSHNTTTNRHSGYRSKGSVNGYSVGGYATWYANDETHTGAHLDTWLQYGWFDNEVKGDNLATETYKSHGISASLEGGYTWKLGEFSGSQGSLNEWFIQPQAQAVWMGVKADNVQEANGTKVSGKGDGNLMTRLGVKTYLKGHSAADNNKQREFQPFLQVNWLHNTRNFATQMDDVRVSQNGATNLAEVKVGLEGKVNPRLNLWGNIAVQMGEAGYNDNAAMVGVKYNF